MILRLAMIIGCCLPLASARAEPRKVAVLAIEAGVGVDAAQAKQVGLTLRRSLGRLGLMPVREAVIDRMQELYAQPCETRRCMDEMLATAGCEMIIGGRLQRGSGLWALSLWVYDPQKQPARGLRRVSTVERCDACDLVGVNHRAEQAIARLLKRAAQPSDLARLELSSDPAGATIEIDGLAMGTTPRTLELSPGRHQFLIKLGRRAQRRAVVLRAGQTRRLRVAFESDAARGTLRWLPWVLTGSALASAGAGAALWIKGKDDPVPGNGGSEAAGATDYRTAGIVLVGVGAALGIAAAVTFYLRPGEGDAERANTALLIPLTEGAMVGYAGRF